MRKVIFRTAEEKADLHLSWSRPNEEFFACGACHVLTAAFLMAYPNAGFRSWGIWPKPGQHGSHTIAMREDIVFDWAGYSQRETFLTEYFEAFGSLFPGWGAEILPVIEDPIGWEFCRDTNSRHPSQFLHDPLQRALDFVARFPPPPDISKHC